MCWRAIKLFTYVAACWWLGTLGWVCWAGTLDIVVVSDRFTDSAEFEAKAEKARVLLASLEPFKSRPDDWTWRTVFQTTSLGCYAPYSRLVVCNKAKAYAAAGTPADRVLVLTKGYGNKGSGGNPAVCSTGTYGWRVCVHELLHLVGNLKDEYVLYPSMGTAEVYRVNCWAGLTPPDTRPWKKGCTAGNWWRLEACTLMRRVDSGSCAYLGELSIKAVNQALDAAP